MKKTNLQVKILALNLLNEYAPMYFEQATKHFEQFIGVDPFKVDGTLKAKYALKFEDTQGERENAYFHINAWVKSTSYSIDINIKICVSGGSYDVHPNTAFCQYNTMTLEIVRVKEGKISQRERQPNDFTVRYSESEILAAAAEVKKAAEAYENALSKVYYEFRDILYLSRLTRS
jgi:hypothetical protein